MENSVYQINKGINKPIEFKGLKAQYIWYLAAGLIGLLIVFAFLYIIGINTFVCMGLVGAGGTFLFMYVYRLSNTYGQYGMMKKMAKHSVPPVIKSNSRKMFIKRSRNLK